jgi:hypothetical protein
MQKGRWGARRVRYGERHPGAKLTEAAVAEIRTLTVTHREIASRYGISQARVSQIKAGKAWRPR